MPLINMWLYQEISNNMLIVSVPFFPEESKD
jgi:hypothetical protein